ncbi:unnamed protein product [Urochloa humidicola]
MLPREGKTTQPMECLVQDQLCKMVDPVGSVEKIVKVPLTVKEAVETIRRNKQECHEICRRVGRVSALLLQLHEREMIKGPGNE